MTVLDDTFTRANSTTSLGSTEANAGTTGTQAWTVSNGTWGILSNRAYRTGTANQHEQATVDIATTDHEVYADLFGGNAENVGLVARFQDTNNHYLLQATIGSAPALYRKSSGSFTSLGTPTGGNCTSGERWGLRCNGSTLTVFRGGSSVLVVTDTSLTTGTRVGLNNYQASSFSLYDNFHGNTYGSAAPTMVSAAVNGATLTAQASAALDPAFIPNASAFTVTVVGVGTRAVNNPVAVSGSTVTLTLASPVTAGQTVTLAYNP